jgi:hypothetical protein
MYHRTIVTLGKVHLNRHITIHYSLRHRAGFPVAGGNEPTRLGPAGPRSLGYEVTRQRSTASRPVSVMSPQLAERLGGGVARHLLRLSWHHHVVYRLVYGGVPALVQGRSCRVRVGCQGVKQRGRRGHTHGGTGAEPPPGPLSRCSSPWCSSSPLFARTRYPSLGGSSSRHRPPSG